MRLKFRKLLSHLYVVFEICQVSCLAAAEVTAEVSFEPMGKSGAPLGTVWVKELDPALKGYHLQMIQRELNESNHSGIQTNIAMFGLNLRQKDGTVVPILDRSSRTFSSGGVRLIRADTEELEDVPAKRKRCEDALSKKEKGLKDARSELTKFAGIAGSDKSGVDEACSNFSILLQRIRTCETDVEQAKSSISQIEQEEDGYAPLIFKGNARYRDYTNAIYDPEQTIARIVDHYISHSVINDHDVIINGKTFKKAEVDSIVLNLHTRTDMCPFCSMFLAHKLNEWRQKLVDLPVMAVVTSRQEYRCAFPFMTEKRYYRGFSMRSFARRRQDDGSSLIGLKKIAEEGLVVQYAFQPEEIYDDPTSSN